MIENYGIEAIELFFPKLYISQKDFETFYNISPNKIT